MFCAISGKPPRHPVLSPSSKCVFEKELIEQYVKQEGKDPITNTPLKVDELINISQNPEQNSFTNSLNSSTLNTNYSIPNLLSTLQNEWDAIMLENFKLRKQLDDCTKKLSISLYERDAAKLVAAKALKSREEISREMGQLVSQLGTSEAEIIAAVESTKLKRTDVDVSGHHHAKLPEELVESMVHDSKKYMETTKRVQSEFSVSTVTSFQLKTSWKVNGSLKIHRAIALRGKNQYKVAFQLENLKEVCYFGGPSEYHIWQVPLDFEVRYLSAASLGDYLLFSSDDGLMGIYDGRDGLNGQVRYLENKTTDIIFMGAHEGILKDYFLWATDSGKIGLSTLDCKTTYVLFDGHFEHKYFQASYHKDGLLLAMATKDSVDIFDLSKPDGPPTSFQVGNEIELQGEIKRVQFGSNGYWMIVHCGEFIFGFDLRKSPGTLAVKPFEIGNQFWDIDISGKNLIILRRESDEQLQLLLHTFHKAKKSWNVDPETETILGLTDIKGQSIKDFVIMYNKEETTALLQTSEQVISYTASGL